MKSLGVIEPCPFCHDTRKGVFGQCLACGWLPNPPTPHSALRTPQSEYARSDRLRGCYRAAGHAALAIADRLHNEFMDAVASGAHVDCEELNRLATLAMRVGDRLLAQSHHV